MVWITVRVAVPFLWGSRFEGEKSRVLSCEGPEAHPKGGFTGAQGRGQRCCSVAQLCLTLLPTAARQASLSFTISRGLLKFISIKSVMPSNHLILCHLLLLLPSIFPSIRVFSNELALCIRWSKYWSFSFSVSPSSEYSGLISFRIDCFDDLLAAQGTFKSLFQHHNSKASVLWL